MNQTSRYAAALCLCAIVFSPIVTTAQATTTPASWYTQDGSNESREVRRERIRRYRQQSNENQQKIDALGPLVITSVPMPVLFGVSPSNISPNFGDPRSGGRTHEGEDIMAASGTPIVSPTPTVILRTGVGPTEGNYVYTANPGGETFVYMHLDRIGEGVVPGAVLQRGALIGYVGNTGNASGGAAHLHFEIHNSSSTPVDPFPRLNGEFTLQEKMTYLSTILAQTSDPTALANLLVKNFRSTFTSAQIANIPLPQVIGNALVSIPASTNPAPAPTPTSPAIPTGDLDVGSSGVAVRTLQTYLIQANSGPAARSLATAGATAYFGPVTKAALLEFQILRGVVPANGYYGATTRTYISMNPVVTTTPTVPSTPINSPAATTTLDMRLLVRDLKQGMTGEDVRLVQKYLNARGFIVAVSGGGSPGNETAYFGPATVRAVIKYQISRNLAPAVGYVGPLTRASIQALR